MSEVIEHNVAGDIRPESIRPSAAMLIATAALRVAVAAVSAASRAKQATCMIATKPLNPLGKLALACVGLAATCVVAFVSPAAASGSCQNNSSATACPVSSGGTYSGALADEDGSDYYSLNLMPPSTVSVSITDTEDPSCSAPGAPANSCGGVEITLYGHTGEGGGDVRLAQSPTSIPSGGSPAPSQGFTYTVTSIWVEPVKLVVDTNPQPDASGNSNSHTGPVPYAFHVSWTSPTGGGGGGTSLSKSAKCKRAASTVVTLKRKLKHAHSARQKRTLRKKLTKARAAARQACGK